MLQLKRRIEILVAMHLFPNRTRVVFDWAAGRLVTNQLQYIYKHMHMYVPRGHGRRPAEQNNNKIQDSSSRNNRFVVAMS